MKEYRAGVDIGATPESIWAIITDAPGLATWDSGIVRVEGRIAPGERIKLVSEANPKRAFALKVTEFSAPRSMTWEGGMPLGLFRGVRTFSLTPKDGGVTRFEVREVYTGPLLNMIWKSMPDLQPSFDKFATGLKARAELAG